MWKKIVVTLLLLPSVLHAQQFKETPYAEKIKDKGLTFAVTFDQKNTNADFSKGNGMSSLANLDLGLRNHQGFDGRNAFRPEGDEELKFMLKDNLDISQGTLLMWVRCGYQHGENGNVGVFQAIAKDEKESVDMKIYIFKDHAHACWKTSIPPHGFGLNLDIPISLAKIKKDEWFQLAITWDKDSMQAFLNGELVKAAGMPAKAAKAMEIKPDQNESWIGFKTKIWDDRNTDKTFIDDIRVYSSVLTPLQTRNQYMNVAKASDRGSYASFGFTLGGVDNLPKLDRLEADFEFLELPEAKPEAILNCRLTGPDGFVAEKTTTVKTARHALFFDGVVKPGEYALTAELVKKDGSEKLSKKIMRPETPFAGTKLGTEDSIPSPFTPMSVDPAQQTVNVWNRTYQFGKSPYPIQVMAGGIPLFKQAPRLQIVTPNGEANIDWADSVLKQVNNCSAVLTGSGRADGFSIDYKTEIEFDGMTHTTFTINGAPEINSMKLKWTVNPECSQFLLDPRLREDGTVSAPYPGSIAEPYQLWLASEKGGICWNIIHDANWVYKVGENILNADAGSGRCEILMITHKTKLPDKTSYDSGVFIATPTRPLIQKRRALRFQDDGRPNGFFWNHSAPELNFGFRKDPKLFDKLFQSTRKHFRAIYSAADSLFEDPVYMYFKKYTEEPGDYSYYMTLRKSYLSPERKGFLYPCRMTSELYQDYRMWKLNNLLDDPKRDQIAMIYSDLSGVRITSNPLDCFKDSFGKLIKPFDLLSRREYFMRKLRICRKYGLPIMLHAQRHFCPALHGLGDYWYPGEQFEAPIRTADYSYFTDTLSDKLWMSEFNSRILGSAVVFFAPGTLKNELKTSQNAEALLSVLLPLDIETCIECVWPFAEAHRNVFRKVWDLYDKYGVSGNDVTVCRFFEQDAIVSSNENVRVTYYKAPAKPYFIILANKTPEDADTIIDLSQLRENDYDVLEEWKNETLQVKDGKLSIQIPARSFRIVGLEAK